MKKLSENAKVFKGCADIYVKRYNGSYTVLRFMPEVMYKAYKETVEILYIQTAFGYDPILPAPAGKVALLWK